ncbi:MAG: hypothetical protein AB1610_10195 [Nitrospirota bacterium]
MKDTSNIETVSVGHGEGTRFLAFGDDSQFMNTVVYAFAIVDRSNHRRADRRIRKIKDKFRIAPDIPIHCRILFRKEQREKHGLTHMSDDDARSLVRMAIVEMNKIPVALRYAYMDLSDLDMGAEGKITLKHVSDDSTIDMPVKYDPKGFIGLLMQSCFAVSPDGREGPPASECQIYTSEDSTKISFIGKERKRADKWYSGFSDIGARENTVFGIEPIILKNSASQMLGVADIFAYLCSHAMEKQCRDTFFREQLGKIKYWSRATFLLN